MDAKEQLFRSIILVMGQYLSKEHHDKLRNVLTTELEKYNIEEIEQKDLPCAYAERNKKLIDSYLISKRIEGLSMNSIRCYDYTLRRFESMFDVDLLNVDTNHFRTYFYHLETLGNQFSTIDNNRRELNSFYQWLVQEDYIRHNPVAKIKVIKSEQKVRNPYSDIEVTKLKDICLSYKEKAIIDLLLTTGIRNSELCDLKLEDVDFYDKSFIVHGKGNKQRTVYFSDGCFYHVNQYLTERQKNGIESEWLFCNDRKTKIGEGYVYGKLSNGNLRRIVRILADKAGIKEAFPHKFRRTFGTNLSEYADITSVQELMGHSSVRTTMLYVASNKNKVRYEHSKLRMSS